MKKYTEYIMKFKRENPNETDEFIVRSINKILKEIGYTFLTYEVGGNGVYWEKRKKL